MTDTDKAKAAKERLDAAKKAAEDAEIVAESAVEGTLEAAEAPDAAASDEAPANDDSGDVSGDGSGEEAADIVDEADPVETNDAAAEESPAEKISETEAAPVAAAPAPARRSFAATALLWLAIFVVGAVAALWFGPRAAPYLPASIAGYLTPAGDRAAETAAALRAEAETRAAALAERLDGIEARIAAGGDEAATARAGLASDLGARIDAAAAAKTDTSAIDAAIADISGRITSMEAGLTGLRAEVDGLAGFTGEAAAPSAETLERVAAFGAAVEGLRAETAELSAAAAKVDEKAAATDLAALAERVEALEGGEAATAGAEADADRIRRSAELDAAMLRLQEALNAGRPFADPLASVESALGTPAPEALRAAAEAGASTAESLSRDFAAAARDGYAAALKAEAGDGIGAGILAAVQGRIGGRPSAETAGDDAGAVLSRIEARLRDGDLAAAATETQSLPKAAQAAMTGWIDRLTATNAARAGMDALTAATTN